MPTRKQKRRREKGRRHEYEYVYVDEEGHEVEVEEEAEPEAADGKPAKSAKAPPKSKQQRSRGRTMREPPEPSWSRSARRAVPWQVGIFVLMVFVFKGDSLIGRIMIAVLYGLLFIPLMYLTDRMVRNRWLKQQGALPQKDKRSGRR
jgi:hypothetical protein